MIEIGWGGRIYRYETAEAAKAAGFQLEGVGGISRPAIAPSPAAPTPAPDEAKAG